LSRGGVKLEADNLAAATFQDTDGDGMKEIVDSWGAALGFYRFPTGNAQLQAKAPASGVSADEIDPDGTLLDPGWQATWLGTFTGTFHALPARGAYIVPVLVSAGPDEALGLNAAMAVTGTQQDYDNIYSFLLR
jgi:hypothetical protein